MRLKIDHASNVPAVTSGKIFHKLAQSRTKLQRPRASVAATQASIFHKKKKKQECPLPRLLCTYALLYKKSTQLSRKQTCAKKKVPGIIVFFTGDPMYTNEKNDDRVVKVTRYDQLRIQEERAAVRV